MLVSVLLGRCSKEPQRPGQAQGTVEVQLLDPPLGPVTVTLRVQLPPAQFKSPLRVAVPPYGPVTELLEDHCPGPEWVTDCVPETVWPHGPVILPPREQVPPPHPPQFEPV